MRDLITDVALGDAPRRPRLCFGICNLLTYDSAKPFLNPIFKVSRVFVHRYTLTQWPFTALKTNREYRGTTPRAPCLR